MPDSVKNQIKVSVIIPIYNMQQHLVQCLESVLWQSLQDIEIICINDGSTDSSGEILKKYKSIYKIIVIEQDNQGSGLARNNGMKIARGKYIAFMDPDDYYPNHTVLETLYNEAERKHVYICGGNFISTRGDIQQPCFNFEKLMTYEEYASIIGFTRFIYNKNFLSENNIYFPSYRRFQDPPFFVNAMTATDKFLAVNIWAYKYRVGHKTFCFSENIVIDVLKGIRDVLQVLIKNNLETFLDKIVCSYLDVKPYVYFYAYKNGNTIWSILKELDRLLKTWIDQDTELNVTSEKVRSYIEQCKMKLFDIPKNIKMIIYGAGVIGKQLLCYFEKKQVDLIGFAVSDVPYHQEQIGEYAIKQINEYIDYKDNAIVYVATSTKYYSDIKKILDKYDFKNVYFIDQNEICLANMFNRDAFE